MHIKVSCNPTKFKLLTLKCIHLCKNTQTSSLLVSAAVYKFKCLDYLQNSRGVSVIIILEDINLCICRVKYSVS